jgi:hypothetical protein
MQWQCREGQLLRSWECGKWGVLPTPANFLLIHTFSPSTSLPTIKMSSPSSKATASSLPKITDLRKLLNFGDASSSRAQGFNEIVRAFRRTYRTSTGVPGVDLHDWKSLEHQSELTKMARQFLDEQNYGRVFWPDIEGDAGNSIKLEYSKNQKLCCYQNYNYFGCVANNVQHYVNYETAFFPP